MTSTFSIRPPRDATTGRATRLLERLAAWLTAPGVRDLDARTLADIGASQTLRAQAELRESWRVLDTPNRWTGL